MANIQSPDVFDSYEYKRSRNAYVAQCSFEYAVSLLVADAFLAKLLSNIGVSDTLAGIISSFISLAFVAQIFSIFLVRGKISRKKLVITLDTISQVLFCCIYFLPFLNISSKAKSVLVIIAILIAFATKYFIWASYFEWANSFVDPTKRAVYSAQKETISLAIGIVFSAVVGYVVDHYESIGNINGGFLFIASSLLILNVCNFVSLLLIKSDKKNTEAVIPFKSVYFNTIGTKSFRRVLVMTILWECARYFSFGFMGTYKTKELLLSVFAVQIINVFANVVRMVVSKPFGQYSDKHSFAKGMQLAMIIASVGFLTIVFTMPETRWLVVLYTVLYSVSMAGTMQNSFNIIYSYVDARYTSQALAIKYSIGGVCGFIASLAGGRVLTAVQENGNTLFGMRIYGQQILGLVSFLLTLITIVYIRKVIVKQKIRIQ